MAEKYNASNIALEQILNFIKSGEIAIPEIQRPFVWKPKQVRDLIDSLYTGYPTGYLIISQSPNMKLKNGNLSEGNEKWKSFGREKDNDRWTTTSNCIDDSYHGFGSYQCEL